jgi:hypothetical protein
MTYPCTYVLYPKLVQPLCFDNYFLNRIPVAQKIRARIDKCDCIKLKDSCTSKETVTRIKRQLTKWEKITSSSTNMGLISIIYKELKNLNSKITIHLINGQMNNSQKYK